MVTSKKNGETFTVEVTLCRVFLDDELIIYATLRDMSELVKAKKSLEENNAMLVTQVQQALKIQENQQQELYQKSKLASMGEMISMIAHQWRQPLASIIAASNTMQVRLELQTLTNQMIADNLTKIDDLVGHLSTTIDEFKFFFKPNKMKEKTNFSVIITEVLKVLNGGNSEEEIKIEVKNSSESMISLYKGEIVHVLLNLLSNAKSILLENHVNNPIIYIDIKEDARDYIIKVEDNGGGINPLIIDKIFDPYFSTKESKNGTGLGLYMSKMVIEDHANGKIYAENSRDGALFTIIIPKEI